MPAECGNICREGGKASCDLELTGLPGLNPTFQLFSVKNFIVQYMCEFEHHSASILGV